MKKAAAVIMAALLITILSVPSVFAAETFKLDTDASYPNEKQDTMDATNVMIKLYFTEDVSSEASQKANADMFEFTDGDGEDVEFAIYYNSKDPKNINLLATGDLATETDYKDTVSGDLTDNAGDTLGKDSVIEFSTRKPASGGTYMLLMMAMIIVMVVMSVRDQRKNNSQEEVKNQTIGIQTNPYKLAKEKGISVEEATKMIAAEREKLAKKTEKMQKKSGASEAEKEKPAAKKPEKRVYKVKTRRIVKKH